MPNRYKNKKDVNSGVFGIKTGLFLGFNPNAFSLKLNKFYNRHYLFTARNQKLPKKKEKSGAISSIATISFGWGSPQYSAAAVQAFQLRMANFLRRLCGVPAPIPQPFSS